MKRLARALKAAILLFACITILPVVVALVGVGVECRVWGGAATAEEGSDPVDPMTADLSGYARREDQTFLTLPEWYIVYSADEYAAFIAENPPSQFPYFRAIGQYWQTYYDVCASTRDAYSFNGGVHLSLSVIGASFTVENILKGFYENTVGRVTEAISSSALTEEDTLAQAVAEEYGDSLHTVPWYEFPFGAKLKGVWAETGFWGPNVIRKWERKIALSLEYGTKSVYGWLIKQGTKGVYGTQDLEILVWAEGAFEEVVQQYPETRISKSIGPEAAIVSLPRYEAFTQIVPKLARQGVRFVEIAGNDEILITVIAPRRQDFVPGAGTVLFDMPILTHPDRKRVVVNVPVPALHRVLNALNSDTLQLEHIYDY